MQYAICSRLELKGQEPTPWHGTMKSRSWDDLEQARRVAHAEQIHMKVFRYEVFDTKTMLTVDRGEPVVWFPEPPKKVEVGK